MARNAAVTSSAAFQSADARRVRPRQRENRATWVSRGTTRSRGERTVQRPRSTPSPPRTTHRRNMRWRLQADPRAGSGKRKSRGRRRSGPQARRNQARKAERPSRVPPPPARPRRKRASREPCSRSAARRHRRNLRTPSGGMNRCPGTASPAGRTKRGAVNAAAGEGPRAPKRRSRKARTWATLPKAKEAAMKAAASRSRGSANRCGKRIGSNATPAPGRAARTASRESGRVRNAVMESPCSAGIPRSPRRPRS